MPINAQWHTAHVMPKNATADQRIEWHIEHAKHCACRPAPEKPAVEMKKRGIKLKRTSQNT